MPDARGGVHRVPDLPYPQDALAPHISADSFDYHYGQHHAAYAAKLARVDFLSARLNHLVNSEEAARRLDGAQP